LDKARDRENKKSNGQWSMVNCQLLNTAEEWNVGKLLARYPEVIMESANEHNPSKLATHLIDLAQSFNTFYHKHKVLGAKNKDLENARLALISKVAQTLKYGLNLLGIDVVDRM
ncbi:hypothetical protein HQ544_02480, partial [Candidatus Falkowbacteria bacterium]|nr:hypothetical protein [Candidatus Falkowbacteria bacterium]